MRSIVLGTNWIPAWYNPARIGVDNSAGILSSLLYDILLFRAKSLKSLVEAISRYVIAGNFQPWEDSYQGDDSGTAGWDEESAGNAIQSDTGGKRGASLDDKAGRLLDLYGDSILRLSYSYVHNVEDAEEILQDTLIRVLSKNPDFKNEAHEKAYLLRTAANLSKNRIEYNDIRSTDELDENLVSDGVEDLSFVWEAVKSLPVHYREVIHLFYEEGYGVKEISNILGRKESTVRSNLKRGREKLRKVLTEEYGYE